MLLLCKFDKLAARAVCRMFRCWKSKCIGNIQKLLVMVSSHKVVGTIMIMKVMDVRSRANFDVENIDVNHDSLDNLNCSAAKLEPRNSFNLDF